MNPRQKRQPRRPEKKSDKRSQRKRKTRIDDLSDECLGLILSRIGNPSLPLRKYADGPPPEGNCVKHPLQCAYVCRRWREVVATTVSMLVLNVNVLTLSQWFYPGQVRKYLDVRLPYLTALRLTKDTVRRPLSSYFPCDLSAFDLLGPRLHTLHIDFPITRANLTDALHLLAACHTLRSLHIMIIMEGPLLEKVQALKLFDAVCELPRLETLTVELYHAEDSEIWERVGAISACKEVYLKSDSIRPHAWAECMPKVLRDLVCIPIVGDSPPPLPSMGAMQQDEGAAKAYLDKQGERTTLSEAAALRLDCPFPSERLHYLLDLESLARARDGRKNFAPQKKLSGRPAHMARVEAVGGFGVCGGNAKKEA